MPPTGATLASTRLRTKAGDPTQARRHWQSQPAGEVRQLLAAGMLMAARGEPSDLLRSLSLEARRAPLRANGPSFPGGGLCCKLAPTRVESLNVRRRAARPHHSGSLHAAQSRAACPSVERGGRLATTRALRASMSISGCRQRWGTSSPPRRSRQRARLDARGVACSEGKSLQELL